MRNKQWRWRTWIPRLAKKFHCSVPEIIRVLSINACQICGSQDGLVIDHDHRTKKLRGLLCSMHNRSLGGFSDSSELLRKAADYLDAASKEEPTK